MSDDKDRPPGERRTDAGSRVIVERLELLSRQQAEQSEALADQLEEVREEFADEVKRLDSRLKARPTRSWVLIRIGLSVAGMLALVWTVIRAGGEDTKHAVREDLRVFRLETQTIQMQSDLKQQLEHRAIYDAMPRKKRSELLERPVQMDGGTTEDGT